ncbi:MAG TPA: DUF4190 domain-containing protein [Nocardioides sp.]|nr:DUF4190 domain-containing protein [Nocardioides sp.]
MNTPVSEPGPPDPEHQPPTHPAYGQRPDDPSAAPPGPVPQPPQQPGYPQYSPYGPAQPPAYGYAGPALPEHPQTNTAFVLGLVSLVGGFVCGLPILVGPFAWAMGARAVREMDAAPGTYGGRDKAKAGMIMGIIATALLGLALFVIAVVVVVIVAAGASTASLLGAL